MEKIASSANITKIGLNVAKNFRLGYEGAANKEFINFIDNLDKLIPNITSPQKNKILNLIEVMLQAQQRNDILFLADILQYELLPLLSEHNSQ